MTDQKKTVEINFPKLLDVLGGIVGRVLLSPQKEQSKSVFKDLKQGKMLNLGVLNYGETLKIGAELKMDYSEFRGPGFNFDVMQAALSALLKQLGIKLKAQQDIKLMGSDEGTQLIGIPGVVQVGEQPNVLMMAVEFTNRTSIVVHLMFMDPDQFMAKAEDTEADS